MFLKSGGSERTLKEANLHHKQFFVWLEFNQGNYLTLHFLKKILGKLLLKNCNRKPLRKYIKINNKSGPVYGPQVMYKKETVLDCKKI